MNLFLIGFMGCGKSYVARNLGEVLQKEVIDLDHYIQQKTEKTIPEIFELFGEEGFREIERTCLHEMLNYQNAIISTGGGVPCFYDNINWMNANGITLFLDVNKVLMLERLKRGREKRPLLKSKTDEKLAEYINQKLQERRPFYEQAVITHFQEAEDGKRIEEIAQILQNWMAIK